MLVSPGQSEIQTVLRSFLLSLNLNYSLPQMTPVEVILGQDNRVPEPQGADFVVMTPIRRDRIETNIDYYADVFFTASIAGTLMSVSTIKLGTIVAGATVFGTGVYAGGSGTIIQSQLSGSVGGTGVYVVSPTQIVPSQLMASGQATYLQPTQVTIQLDVHGPNSADNAQTISTLMRDQFAVTFFNNIDQNVSPLHADDPRQIPFVNDQNQVETRWVIEALIQANQAVQIPQQFMSAISVKLINVDATYHP